MLSSSLKLLVCARYLDFLLTIYLFLLYFLLLTILLIIDLFLNIKNAHIFRRIHLIIRMREVYRYLRKEIWKEGIKTCRAAKQKERRTRNGGGSGRGYGCQSC